MSKSEEYGVLCGCGQTLDGKRKDQFQRVLCKECGESIFILPHDVYPSIKSTNGQKTKKKRKKSGRSQKSKKGPNRIGAMFGLVAQRSMAGVQRSKTATASAARKIFTPFRLVILTILFAIGGTGYWVWFEGKVEEARESLRVAKIEAEKALSSGNFFDASKHYKVAADAVDMLGRDDEEANALRQLARETEAIRNLAGGTLFEMLLEAETTESPEDWADRFRVAYKDRWLLFTPVGVVRTNDENGAAQYSIDLPMIVGTRSVQFEGALEIFDRLRFERDEEKPALDGSISRDVAFAVQVVDCKLETQESEHWTVTVRPETAFLWSNFHMLTQINSVDLPSEDDDSTNPDVKRLQALLDEQATVIAQTQFTTEGQE